MTRTTSSARVVGPDPYPRMVRDFQSVIGRGDAPADAGAHRPPPAGRRGPASAGDRTRWGCSIRSWRTPKSSWWESRPRAKEWTPPHHAATLTAGKPGVLHGSLSYLLQDEHGQVAPRARRSPPGSTTRAWGRSTAGFTTPPAPATPASPTPRRWTPSSGSARLEGIIPALESAHAIAFVLREGKSWKGEGPIVICPQRPGGQGRRAGRGAGRRRLSPFARQRRPGPPTARPRPA